MARETLRFHAYSVIIPHMAAARDLLPTADALLDGHLREFIAWNREAMISWNALARLLEKQTPTG